MSRESKAKQRGRPARVPDRQRFLVGAVVLLAVAAVVALGIWVNRSQPTTAVSGNRPVETNSANPIATAAAPKTEGGFQKLVGRWLRTEGDYVIEIKSVADNGNLDAAYLNPNPIHVARAEASLEGSAVKVFIELRDVNYPGSTYTLAYDPAGDLLKGIYYQAVAQERFEVLFERLK